MKLTAKFGAVAGGSCARLLALDSKLGNSRIPLVFLGAGLLAFATTGVYIPGTLERFGAALAVGIAAVAGKKLGRFIGEFSGDFLGEAIERRKPETYGKSGIGYAFILAGIFGMAGAGFGIYKGYDLSRDFMIANLGDQAAAIEVREFHAPMPTVMIHPALSVV